MIFHVVVHTGIGNLLQPDISSQKELINKYCIPYLTHSAITVQGERVSSNQISKFNIYRSYIPIDDLVRTVNMSNFDRIKKDRLDILLSNTYDEIFDVTEAFLKKATSQLTEGDLQLKKSNEDTVSFSDNLLDIKINTNSLVKDREVTSFSKMIEEQKIKAEKTGDSLHNYGKESIQPEQYESLQASDLDIPSINDLTNEINNASTVGGSSLSGNMRTRINDSDSTSNTIEDTRYDVALEDLPVATTVSRANNIKNDLNKVEVSPLKKQGKGHTNGIFVMHGDNIGLLSRVKEVLAKFDLHPITFKYQGQDTSTIFEAIDGYKDINIAIALYTESDFKESPDSANINVNTLQAALFTHGYLQGRLSKNGLISIVNASENFVKLLPTNDVIYFNNSRDWIIDLMKQFVGKGFNIDLKKALFEI